MRFHIAPLLIVFSQLATAQVSVDVSGYGVKSGSGSTASGSGNTAVNETGVISPDAEIEGVTTINDNVWIDGVKIARGVTEYFSKKTRKAYTIRWGKKGEGATVTEKP
ncbi:conserved exported hypothetical protein [Candidatus Accumulibacter aalborgensis]|uniref:Uncharacterized protein n=1 Tax=Candidatus Accumulibacter aalborgensis TaxID=1860102 RepID=A0A1A8XF50_9PROT|nr:hypothetical protein [Candidatus Accumulibacter aalborgensis]SBT03356.1 conserved exported hypothetical protein [Candidatus Accumulibacter aalborgensis]